MWTVEHIDFGKEELRRNGKEANLNSFAFQNMLEVSLYWATAEDFSESLLNCICFNSKFWKLVAFCFIAYRLYFFLSFVDFHLTFSVEIFPLC